MQHNAATFAAQAGRGGLGLSVSSHSIGGAVNCFVALNWLSGWGAHDEIPSVYHMPPLHESVNWRPL